MPTLEEMTAIHKVESGIYKKQAKYVISLLLLSLLACSGWLNPLFPKTHEGYSSVFTLMDFDKAFRDGNLLVNWLPTVAGAGEPTFNFYPPLVYYVSEFIHLLGVSFINTIKVVFIISYFLSGLFMFLFVKKLTNNSVAAWVAAAAYIFNPYHLVDSNLRGDFAESFSFVFIPLVFYYVYDSFSRNHYVRPVLCAGISYALVILCHVIIAYMAGIFVLIYSLHFLLMKTTSASRLLLRLGIIGSIALSLSVFYWFPALLERNYVDFTFLTNILYRPENNFIYLSQLLQSSQWIFGSSGAGLNNTMPLGLGAFSILVFMYNGYVVIRNRDSSGTILCFEICLFLSALLTTDYGLPILKMIPMVDIIQFPWRFLLFSAFFCSVLSGYIVEDFSRGLSRNLVGFVLFCVLLVSSFQMLSIPGGYMLYDAPISEVSVYYLQEYLPVHNGIAAKPFGRGDFPDVIYTGKYTFQEKRSTYWKLSTYSEETSDCNVKIFYYPRWKCYEDGIEKRIWVSENGTISFSISEGVHVIEIKYEETYMSILSKVWSLLVLIVMLLVLFVERGKSRLQRQSIERRKL